MSEPALPNFENTLLLRPKDRRLLYSFGGPLILSFALSVCSLVLLIDYPNLQAREWAVVILGVLLLLSSIMLARNAFALHTILDVSPEQIGATRLPMVRHRTLVVPRPKVVQLFVSEHAVGLIFRTRLVYGLNLVLDNGVTLRIAGGIPEYETAHEMERMIERYWKIPDQPVPGEIRK